MGNPHNKSHGKIPNWPSHRRKKWREEQPSKTPRNPQQTGRHVDVLKHGYENSETQRTERGEPCQVITT